jgi:hypothetical protein
VSNPENLANRLRALALSLPETYEDEPWGHPGFKVGDNKMLASLVDAMSSGCGPTE